jgi:FK506-binding protein 4/5
MADDAFDLPSAGVVEEMMGGLEEDEAMKDLDDAGVDADEDYFPPTMKVGEEKEIGKEGLKKKLVKEGEGWDRPETGDEVEGTYVFFRR